jgi:hypothetical protein
MHPLFQYGSNECLFVEIDGILMLRRVDEVGMRGGYARY